MITSEDAIKFIFENISEFGQEKINTLDAIGKILREPIQAERDQPPFDRVTMDGIAINFNSYELGRRSFLITETQFAGDSPSTLEEANSCIEIMTGSILPTHTNCIIPIEQLIKKDKKYVINQNHQPKKYQYIHRQGSDHKLNALIFDIGHKIKTIDISAILSCNKDNVSVNIDPKIAVISTGNELVAAGKKIFSHQIRMSNGPAILSMLKNHNYENCEYKHLIDDKEVQYKNINEVLNSSDVIILSGGVSMGKADYVPEILRELGVKNIFHKILQRPGKPMWFGIGPKGQLVFALPGNPVSTITCCRHYVIPALNLASGQRNVISEFVQLQKNIIFKPPLTYLLPVKIRNSKNGILEANPVETNTSGDFTTLIDTDGYIELPSNKEEFNKSEIFSFYRW